MRQGMGSHCETAPPDAALVWGVGSTFVSDHQVASAQRSRGSARICPNTSAGKPTLVAPPVNKDQASTAAVNVHNGVRMSYLSLPRLSCQGGSSDEFPYHRGHIEANRVYYYDVDSLAVLAYSASSPQHWNIHLRKVMNYFWSRSWAFKFSWTFMSFEVIHKLLSGALWRNGASSACHLTATISNLSRGQNIISVESDACVLACAESLCS